MILDRDKLNNSNENKEMTKSASDMNYRYHEISSNSLKSNNDF